MQMMDNFGFEIEILEIRQKDIEDLSQNFPRARLHLFDESFQSPR